MSFRFGTLAEWRLARCQYSFADDGGAAGALPLFAVTGTVLVQVFGVCQTSLASAHSTATIELGIAGNTAALIAQTNAVDLDQYETWQDSSPEANPAALDLTARTCAITNGADINLNIGTEDLAAGVVDFYCLWLPLSDGATVASI